MKLGKEVFFISGRPKEKKKKQLVRHDPSKEDRKADQKEKSTECWGYRRANHRQHAQEQKPPTAMLREKLPLPFARETSRGYLRFSFLDVEERTRLSMPSFSLQVQKSAKKNHKHCQNIDRSSSVMMKECNEGKEFTLPFHHFAQSDSCPSRTSPWRQRQRSS